MLLAEEEARLLDHNWIGTEHLLLGLLREGDGVAARALESLGISLQPVREQVEEIIGQVQQHASEHIAFTPRSEKVMELLCGVGSVAMTEPDFLRDTRTSYDAVATGYAERLGNELAAKPLDRAMLTGFAELVQAAGAGPVADVGCGTGRVIAYLDGLGLPVFGIDLSPGMIEVARRTYPGLRFEVGSMLALDLPDAALGGVLAWYSTIHVPDERLLEAFAEFCRVLAPGGVALLGFQAGDESVHLAEALGHPVALDFRRRQPEQVAQVLGRAGLEVRARLLREPDDDGDFPERQPQAFVLARKPTQPGQRDQPGTFYLL